MWVQSGTFVCTIIVLNLNRSFKFWARLGFNVIWFVQCAKGDNSYCNYADGSLCCNYAGGIFCSALCMTVSIVTMQVTFPYSYVGDSFKAQFYIPFSN